MVVLDKLLLIIEDIVQKLDELVNEGYDINDWRDQMAILHALQVEAQAMIDLCERLLSNMGETSEGYKDSIKKLREKGILTSEEEKFLLSVIGFRNIVVHEYAEINFDFVEKILSRKDYKKILEIAMKIKERAKEYWDP
ncbi:DUF86 domain-containing protein [Sulfurisphaera javensis]|uniref:DUF86 domain-containing protein n=1 Tax=Sulfurisphaera javensis TaxID=2049879 RepID=A0AAT9GTM8_9CREN